MPDASEALNLTNDITDEQAENIVELCKADPEWFVRNVLGGDPWSGQVEIMEAVRDHKEVSVKSCNSSGKDWICARIVLWFVFCHKPCLCLTTGPTDRQVKAILWKEIATAYNRSLVKYGGMLLTQELHLTVDRWAIGFTTLDDPDRFSGYHSPNLLAVVDEASGMKQAIIDALAGVLSGENNRKLEIGNPNNPSGPFAQSFKTPGVKKITISAFDTPNFTAFGITLEDMQSGAWRSKVTGDLPRPELITPEWVEARLKRWGVNNPLFQARVLAQFPKAGKNTLIPLTLIEAAQNRTLEPGEPHVLGVDVARFGDDMNVICRRQGGVLRILERFGKVDTMETTGHVRIARRETAATVSIVDVVGIGAGVVDRLVEQGEPVQEASAGSSAIDTERFPNARSEWYWTLREAFENGEIDLDPDDEELAAQLSDITWKPDSKGRCVIESKEDMKKRGVSSPDDADAAAHTFAGESEFTEKYKQAMENLGG